MHSSQALTIQIATVVAAAAAQDSRNGRFVTYSTILKEALYDEKYDQPKKFVKQMKKGTKKSKVESGATIAYIESILPR